MADNVVSKLFLDAPASWQFGFQNPATPIMEGIIWLHNYIVFYLIIVIIVVFWFLFRSIYLFNELKNPEVAEFNHDPVIETVWTIAPAFILVAIAIPSFSLLYSIEETFMPAFTLKVIGHQWYWSYEFGGIRRTDNLHDYINIERIPSKVGPGLFVYGLQRFLNNTDLEWLSSRNLKPYKPVEWLSNTNYFWDLVAKEQVIRKYIQRHSYSRFLATVIQYKLPKHTTNDICNLSYAAKLASTHWIYPVKFRKHWILWWIKTQFVGNQKAVFKSMLPITTHLENVHVPQGLVKVTFFSIIKPITKVHSFTAGLKWVSPSLKFDSYMLGIDQLTNNGLRLLEVDNKLILPVRTSIKLLITSADVIHSWAVPSFGIKMDAIPGRLNQVHLFIKRQGQFYGQCSELCGVNHAFMPISVKAVSFGQFVKWFNANSNPSNLDALVTSDWEIRINAKHQKGKPHVASSPKLEDKLAIREKEALAQFEALAKWGRESKKLAAGKQVLRAPIQDQPAPVPQAPIQDQPAPVPQAPIQDQPAPVPQAQIQDQPAPVPQAQIQDKPVQGP